jgi:hypothetical protein
VLLKNLLHIKIAKKSGVLTLMISQLSPLELVKATPPQNLILTMRVWELNLSNNDVVALSELFQLEHGTSGILPRWKIKKFGLSISWVQDPYMAKISDQAFGLCRCIFLRTLFFTKRSDKENYSDCTSGSYTVHVTGQVHLNGGTSWTLMSQYSVSQLIFRNSISSIRHLNSVILTVGPT